MTKKRRKSNGTPKIILLAIVIAFFAGVAQLILGRPSPPRCAFDRNELGPMGDHGQWYWEYYKCSDGTERRQLVAGPRG